MRKFSLRLFATSVFICASCAVAPAVQVDFRFGGYFFLENKRDRDGEFAQQIQFGVDAIPESIVGPVSGTWGTAPYETPFEGQPFPLIDFGITQGVGDDPFVTREFGNAIQQPHIRFLATRDLQMTLSDSVGSTSVILPALLPDSVTTDEDIPFIPLVENVIRTEGSAPMLGWDNPLSASELHSIGVDAIRLRVFEDTTPFFSRIHLRVFDDLSTDVVQLPDLLDLSTIPNPDFFAWIEYIDSEEVVQIIDGAPIMTLNDRNRSTYRIDLNDVPVVDGPIGSDRTPPTAIPLPSTLSLTAALLLLPLFVRRRRVTLNPASGL